MATAVLGMQWGDEGKGKVAHLLAASSQMVVRWNGGPNAGHTMFHAGVKFGTHLVPAGVFYPGVESVVATGVVVDLSVLREEVETISRHLGFTPKLILSESAHLILPYHRLLEDLEGSGAKFGTTRRGIAPAYRDRAAKAGVRAGDLLVPARLRERIDDRVGALRRAWPGVAEVGRLSAERLAEDLLKDAAPFLSSISDASGAIQDALAAGKEVLFEGAQGALLDVDFGTYPYVTSSTTAFTGLAAGTGVPDLRVERRLGIVKAYQTRVGDGPFPTELSGEVAERLRKEGGEFGVVTGRPRRCGWLDLVALRHAARLNAPTGIVVTKLDVLSGLQELRVCRAYERDGMETTRFPADAEDLARCRPVYETVPGWEDPLRGVRDYERLPAATRGYLDRIAEAAGAPVALVSVGPAPEETILTGFDTPEGDRYNPAH